jgi:hypothetical protein
MSYTVSLKNSSKKTELKKQLDDGDIGYSFDIYKSTSVSDDHDAVIDGWVSIYAKGNSEKKSQLESLKKRKVGDASGFFKGTVKDGMKVKMFALKFTAKDKDGDRTYYEASANIELTSDKEDSKKLINSYFEDLAVLAITGGSDSYTIAAE